jgi:hypothetical protein
MRRSVVLGLVIAVSLTLAPQAAGHGVIRRSGDVLRYDALDDAIGAKLTITSPRPGILAFEDPISPGGIDWGPCFPAAERRAECAAKGISRVDVFVYDGDDQVTVRAAVPVRVDAGPGDDRIIGGYGADELNGGTGNDTLIGGEGADLVNGGSGSDRIEIRDGTADRFSCGAGTDTVIADPADPAPPLLECESLSRAALPPDRKAPAIRVKAKEGLSLGGRALRIPVAISEPGRIKLTGSVIAGKRTLAQLGQANAKPDSPNQTSTLRPRMRAGSAKKVKRALGKGRHLRAKLVIKATDRAGNSQTQRTKLPLGRD